jgi:cytochrome c biogenesis protein
VTSLVLRCVNLILIVICLAAAVGTFPENTLPFLKKPGLLFAAKPFLVFLGTVGVLAVWHTVRKGIHLFRMKDTEDFAPNGNETSLQDSRPVGIPFSGLPAYRDRISVILQSKRYGVRADLEKTRFSLTGAKDLGGVWGSFLVHAGLVVVLLAGLLTYVFAEIRDIEVEEGMATLLPRAVAKIKLEKFSVMLDPAGRAASYVSRLLVQDRDGRIEHHDLKVNAPLQILGVRVFQMRYRVKIREIQLAVYRNGEPFGAVILSPGVKKGLPGLPYLVQAGEIVPDFVRGPDGRVQSRSPYFRNPAVQLTLFPAASAGAPERKLWVFSDLFSHKEAAPEEWAFAIRKIRKSYVSGMKVSDDPGWPLAYAGFVVMILGAFLSAFVIPRRIRMSFTPDGSGEGTVLECSGACSKDPAGLKYEAGVILREMDRLWTGSRS